MRSGPPSSPAVGGDVKGRGEATPRDWFDRRSVRTKVPSMTRLTLVVAPVLLLVVLGQWVSPRV
jgi:hypothetical protein